MGKLCFSKDIKIVSILDFLQTAAATDRTSKVIDTAGFDAMCIVIKQGTMAASSTTTYSLNRSNVAADADTLTGGAAVLGSGQALTATDDNKVYYMDHIVLDDRERYYQLSVDKNGTNTSDEAAIVFLYNAAVMPVTQATGSGVGEGTVATTGELFATSVEGTA